MPMRKSELNQMTATIEKEHKTLAVSLACLIHLASVRMSNHGRANGQAVRKLHALGLHCVKAYALRMGLPWSDVKAATKAVSRAGKTARYLHDLPE